MRRKGRKPLSQVGMGRKQSDLLGSVDVSEPGHLFLFRESACSWSGSTVAGARSGGLRVGGNSTSPRQETPVPSMVTLHTAHTGAFFRKTFSLKLCGSAFLGCGRDGRQTEV